MLRGDIAESKRNSFALAQKNNEFEELLSLILGEQIPKVYLENYSAFKQQALSAYPPRPQVIFTANDFYANEGFKFWAAAHVERGVRFIGGQHGGLYGAALCHAAEEHEIKVSDKYLTWGWREADRYKTVPISAAKLNVFRRGFKAKPDGRILLALATMPRYSYHLYSAFVGATGVLRYLEDQYRFAAGIRADAREFLTVRLYQHDYGWEQLKRWQEKFPDLGYDLGAAAMRQVLKKCRLFVGTYNSTTYLETFTADFPTILFWDPDCWELRESAKPYFAQLKRAGILHDTPESAAAKVNEIFNDPRKWWLNQGVQQAKNNFCRNFARVSDSWLPEWKRELSRAG